MKIRIIFVFAFLMAINGQAQEVAKLLNTYFTSVRTGVVSALPKELTAPANAKIVLAEISIYLNDTLPQVRARAYEVSKIAASSVDDVAIREQAIKQLVEGCKDTDSGNVGLALNYLITFHQKDFSSAAKDSVRNLVKRRISYFDLLLKLTGFLQLIDLKEQIRSYTQPGNTQSVRWSAIVSLARMNDPSAIEEMMRRAKKLGVNDDVVYEIFPGLIYSRQHDAINYMVQAMESNEPNCESANAENETKIPCSYRIMELLAKAVADYPLQVDASGDIKTNDYKKALETARTWFKQKGNNYTTYTERF
jgi:hypothetical protein